MDTGAKNNWITVDKELDPSSVQIPKIYQGCLESVLISDKDIKARVKELTEQIAAYYANRPFVIIVVLKGSFIVFSEIYENLVEIYSQGKHDNKIIPEFIRLKHYRDDHTTNEVMAKGVDELDVEGKEVLIVEDIVDSGGSMRTLLKILQEKKHPKDVKIFTLLIKKERTNFDFNLDYVGFEIPNKFCVGYGIDYNEKFRDLSSLCVINQHGIEKFKSK